MREWPYSYNVVYQIVELCYTMTFVLFVTPLSVELFLDPYLCCNSLYFTRSALCDTFLCCGFSHLYDCCALS